MQIIVGDVFTLIDDEDFEKIKDFTLGVNGDGYIVCYHTALDSHGELLHRFLMKSRGSGLTVDHKNKKILDNTKENLRLCSYSQNNANRGGNKFGNPTSSYKGIHKPYKRKNWYSQIRFQKKPIYLGVYDHEIEAAIAYDTKAKELYGEFAVLNFPTNELLMKACLELATLKTNKYKHELAPPNIFPSPPTNGGSYGTPKPEKTSAILQSYAQYLPQVLQATNSQAVPTAQANLAADQATAGGEQQLNTDLTRQFAPQLAAINSQVQDQQAQAGSASVAKELAGSGADAASAATALSRANNPDYWKTQDAAAKSSQDLLGSYNLNGLSPGESNAVERSTNQSNTATGNLGLANPTNTVSNALNFGAAFDAKRAAMNTAIGTANNTATSSMNNGVNPVGVATMQPGTTGATQFAPSTTGSTGASSALNFGTGLLGNQFSQNNATIGAAASRANANSVPAFMGAVPSYS